MIFLLKSLFHAKIHMQNWKTNKIELCLRRFEKRVFVFRLIIFAFHRLSGSKETPLPQILNMNLNKRTIVLFLKTTLLVCIFLVQTALTQGAPPGPPGGGGGPPCWPPPCIPVNKGLIFLALAAFLLAAYKLRLFRSKPDVE